MMAAAQGSASEHKERGSGANMDFGFLRPPFALTVKDARTGGELATPEVRGSDTVADLKAKLRASDVIPQDAVKVHVAHGGKLLQDADGLEMLRAVPVVVLAIVRPPPPPTTPTPTEAILEALRLRQPAAPPPQPPQPPPTACDPVATARPPLPLSFPPPPPSLLLLLA